MIEDVTSAPGVLCATPVPETDCDVVSCDGVHRTSTTNALHAARLKQVELLADEVATKPEVQPPKRQAQKVICLYELAPPGVQGDEALPRSATSICLCVRMVLTGVESREGRLARVQGVSQRQRISRLLSAAAERRLRRISKKKFTTFFCLRHRAQNDAENDLEKPLSSDVNTITVGAECVRFAKASSLPKFPL